MKIDSSQKSCARGVARGGFIRKYVGTGLKYIIPLAVSVALIYWLFKKVNFHEVMQTIHDGCDFFWIGVMMLITMGSHMIRGVRWGMQLRSVGVHRMPAVCEWCTIWGAYALNLLFPQLGEGWRCVYVSRREKAPLSTVIGTDVGDRGSDFVVIVILFAVALVVAHPQIMDFVTRYSFGRDIDEAAHSFWLWVTVGALLAVFWAVCHYLKYYRWVSRLDKNLDNVWQGIKVIFTMKQRYAYLVLTLCIWTCYFLETYCCFLAFPFTRRLMEEPGMAYGLLPGLVVFVFGSCSMAVPSNGGLGPWNIAVIFALSLFSISNTEGTAYSMVMWSMQSLTYIVLGIFSAIYFSATSKKDAVNIRPTSGNATEDSRS